jgi:D-sedoheptulose 7-phosphate isomerase
MTTQSMQTFFHASLNEAEQVFQSLHVLEANVCMAAEWCTEALKNGHKLLVCGNGGSACEAQHLVGELMGRYKKDRPSLPAVAMSADSAVLTCIGNDYSFEDVFARQIRALGQPGDVVVVFSTSGNSPNVLRALEAAADSQLKSIAFLGREGGAAAALAECPLIVHHKDTARIQEGHQFLMHALVEYIEAEQCHE